MVCCLYSRLFASASADATGQSHRGVRPPCIRIAAAAVRGRYEVVVRPMLPPSAAVLDMLSKYPTCVMNIAVCWGIP